MNISNWGVGRIMQLPECVFGDRHLVSCSVLGGDGTEAWGQSVLALPERAVIWEYNLWLNLEVANISSARVGLSDQLPASTAAFDEVEPLLPGFGEPGAEPRELILAHYGGSSFGRLKMPVQSAGRRLVMEVACVQDFQTWVTVSIVVSRMPTSIPDWLAV